MSSHVLASGPAEDGYEVDAATLSTYERWRFSGAVALVYEGRFGGSAFPVEERPVP